MKERWRGERGIEREMERGGLRGKERWRGERGIEREMERGGLRGKERWRGERGIEREMERGGLRGKGRWRGERGIEREKEREMKRREGGERPLCNPVLHTTVTTVPPLPCLSDPIFEEVEGLVCFSCAILHTGGPCPL